MTQSDTPLETTKPLQIDPHFQSNVETDAFGKAHANADTDSGDSALHHTLGHLGGAAKYDHDHGVYTKLNLGMRGSPAPNIGSTGVSLITYQKIAKQLMYVRFFTQFNGSGIVVGSLWRYDWTLDFVYKKKIQPASAAVLEAVYYEGGHAYIGKLIWDGSNAWYYHWKRDDASAPVGTIGGMTQDTGPYSGAAGSFAYATGIYEFKDVS